MQLNPPESKNAKTKIKDPTPEQGSAEAIWKKNRKSYSAIFWESQNSKFQNSNSILFLPFRILYLNIIHLFPITKKVGSQTYDQISVAHFTAEAVDGRLIWQIAVDSVECWSGRSFGFKRELKNIKLFINSGN